MVGDTSLLLNQALDDGKTVLFEGAQATMLDVDHGTYPFVTSLSAIAGGVCTARASARPASTASIGVIKAYTTRVGSGPFPTELFDNDGRSARSGSAARSASRPAAPVVAGGTTPVVARYAARVNGLTEFA